MSEKKNQETLITTDKESLEDNHTLFEENIPEKEYLSQKKKSIKKITIGLICIMMLELGMAGYYLNVIIKDDIHTRVIREYRYQVSGKLKLNTGTYIGDMDFGIFQGNGEFIFDTGSVYKGEWVDNLINGLGVLKIPSEGEYEGEFSNGLKSGKGIFTWNDGDLYDGEWMYDQMHGQGRYTTLDNIVYSGRFENNLFKEGTCVFKNDTGDYVITFKENAVINAEIHYKDGSEYLGTSSKSNIDGSGRMIFANEDSYTGEFENSKRSGKGKYIWKTGESYDGDWLNDDMHGTGTYTYSPDNYARGTFEKNIFIKGFYHLSNNFGVYKFTIDKGEPTAVEMILSNGTQYSGGMSNGKLNGSAQITYSNGDKYSGSVSNNQKSGKGTYTWASGATYDGSWSEDRMNGSGTYIYSKEENGYKLTGKFKDGRPDGECTYYVSSSEYYKTDWSNGVCVKVYE